MPDPVPDPVTVIHEAKLDDVQEHPDIPVTVMGPVPPAAGTAMVTGLTEKVHDAPGWLTLKPRPPIVSAADLAPTLGFASTVNETVPDPVWVEPSEIVIHVTGLVADHGHVDDVVTVTVTLPPAAPNGALVGESVYEQDDGA